MPPETWVGCQFNRRLGNSGIREMLHRSWRGSVGPVATHLLFHNQSNRLYPFSNSRRLCVAPVIGPPVSGGADLTFVRQLRYHQMHKLFPISHLHLGAQKDKGLDLVRHPWFCYALQPTSERSEHPTTSAQHLGRVV